MTATWLCFECSDLRNEEVLVCEACLEREHDGHWAEKLLY